MTKNMKQDPEGAATDEKKPVIVGRNVYSRDLETISKHLSKDKVLEVHNGKASSLLEKLLNNDSQRAFIPSENGNFLISRDGDSLTFNLGVEEVTIHFVPVGAHTYNEYREGINSIAIGTSLNLFSESGDPNDSGNHAISKDGKLLLFKRISADYGYSNEPGSSHGKIPMAARIIDGDGADFDNTLAATINSKVSVETQYLVSTTNYSFDAIRDAGLLWALIHSAAPFADYLINNQKTTSNYAVHINGGFCYCKAGFGARSSIFHPALVEGIKRKGDGLRFDASFSEHNHAHHHNLLDFVEQMHFRSSEISLTLEKDSKTDLSTLLSDYATDKLTYLAIKQVYDTLKIRPDYHCASQGTLSVHNMEANHVKGNSYDKRYVGLFTGLEGDTDSRGGIVFPGQIGTYVTNPISHYEENEKTHLLTVLEKNVYVGEYRNKPKRSSFSEDKPVFDVKIRAGAQHPMMQVVAIKNLYSTADGESFGIGPIYLILPTQSYEIAQADGVTFDIEVLGVTRFGSRALATVKDPTDFSILHGVKAFIFKNLLIHSKNEHYGVRGLQYKGGTSIYEKKSNRVFNIQREVSKQQLEIDSASNNGHEADASVSLEVVPDRVPKVKVLAGTFSAKDAALKWFDTHRNVFQSDVDRFLINIATDKGTNKVVFSKFDTRNLFPPDRGSLSFTRDLVDKGADLFLCLENQILPKDCIRYNIAISGYDSISVYFHPSRKIVYINEAEGKRILSNVKVSIGNYLYSTHDIVLVGLAPVSEKYKLLNIIRPTLRPFVIGAPFNLLGFKNYIQQFAADNPSFLQRFRNTTLVDTSCFDVLPAHQDTLTKNEIAVLLDHSISGFTPITNFDEQVFYDTINENHQFSMKSDRRSKSDDCSYEVEAGKTTIIFGDYQISSDLPDVS